jgi:hypothetical protein
MVTPDVVVLHVMVLHLVVLRRHPDDVSAGAVRKGRTDTENTKPVS